MLLKASSAVTVKLNAVPAVIEAGAETAKCVAAPGATSIAFDVPVSAPSATVMVRIPAARVDVTMKEGDTIWTESSYKYGHDEIEVLLERAGFRLVERWLAGEERFLLTLARAK